MRPEGAASRRTRDDLIVANQDLLQIATAQFRGLPFSPGLDREDLVGEGQIALIHAAMRYDPTRGTFRSFAFRRVKGAMLDALRRDHFLSRHAREHGHKAVVVSIDKPMDVHQATLSDTIADNRPPVEEIVEQRQRLLEAVSNRERLQAGPLTPSEIEVLRGAARGETAAETASRLRKSINTVRSQRRTALGRLGARSVAHAVYIAHDQIAA